MDFAILTKRHFFLLSKLEKLPASFKNIPGQQLALAKQKRGTATPICDCWPNHLRRQLRNADVSWFVYPRLTLFRSQTSTFPVPFYGK